MCGIFGILSLDGSPFLGVRPNLDGLRHRGPDNSSEARFPHAILAHTRLAVIDAMETSNQPLRANDLVAVCNGEILNHRELRAERGRYVYRTSSDCEAVVDLYHREGVDGFKRLDGFFSFALLDLERNVVILHRDNVGKKPLFWSRQGHRLVFASNVTAVADNLDRALRIDPTQIPFFLENGFIDPRASLFQGVQPVLPGELITIDLTGGDVRRSRLDKPFRSYVGFDWEDEPGVQREMDRLLRIACEKRVRGLESPVLLFSGGLDSTVLGHELAELSSKTKLVTLKQPLPWLNDAPYAREAADRIGRQLLYARPPRRLFASVDELVRKQDQPLALPSYFYLALLALAARSFGNVLFTGDGADEVFFGYRDFDAWEGDGREEDVAAPLISGPPFAFPLSRYGQTQGIVDLVGHGFVKVDKSTAENAMEARCPFLDWDLMTFVRQAPRSYWRRRARDHKEPLKRYLRARGSGLSFTHRPKLGFAFPLRYLLVPALERMRKTIRARASLMRDLGVDPRVAESPVASFRNFQRTLTHYVLADHLGRIAHV
jgi:asparagine synthase (glutamine-hydrolysing)